MAVSKIKGGLETILPFGTHQAVGDYTLSRPITDFRFLILRLGAATDNASGGGGHFQIVPVSPLLGYSSSTNWGVEYYLNGKWYNITFYLKNATTLHISNVRNITDGNATISGSGIRSIYGI